MMMVPVQIKPSRIDGLGIFSILPVPKGIVVWRYCEPVDYRMVTVPPKMKGFAIRYAYIPIGKPYYEFVGDSAMFINHSSSPNIIYSGEENMIASRDIKAGEEITANYFEFDEKPESCGKLRD
jgi:hypothetical protein